MVLTRFARRWWAAPVLLPLLCVDLWWFSWHGEHRSQVAEWADRLFAPPDMSGSPHVSVPKVAVWRDGDARLVGGSWNGGGFLSSKPPRGDAPLGYVAVTWGSDSIGLLAPNTLTHGVFINNYKEVRLNGAPLARAVVAALADGGHPLPPQLSSSVCGDGVTSVSTFLWWGAAHDLVVVPAWIVAVGAVWFRIGALGRAVKRSAAPLGVCVQCRYDLSGLPFGRPCPECGEATDTVSLSRTERRRNVA